MSGNKEGAALMRQAMIERLGSKEAWVKWMRDNASKGGKASGTGGFYNNHELAVRAGSIGGKVSSRKGVKGGESRINQISVRQEPDPNPQA